MTEAQRAALKSLCERYHVEFNEDDYNPDFSLPTGWVSGWVGGPQRGMIWRMDSDGTWVHGPNTTIFVGCDPEGNISS